MIAAKRDITASRLDQLRRRHVRATSGTGWDVTTRDRMRRAFAFVSGLMAAADRHLDITTLGRLRELARAHDRQSALISGTLDRAMVNIVGNRLELRAATGDEELDRIADDYIRRRMEPGLCDARGLDSLAEITQTALRAVWTDGDQVLVKRRNGALQAYEADQVVTPGSSPAYAKATQGTGRRVVLGVELNRYNRPVAYWLQGRQTTGDYGYAKSGGGGRGAGFRVPAGQCIVPSYRKRANQTRGVPFLAAALNIYDRLDSYIDNETMAAVANAMFGWKITRQPGAEAFAGVADNTDTLSTFAKVQKMEPLMILDLLEGEDVEMIGSLRPGDTFGPYTLLVARIVGAALGFPLELLLLDFSKSSWSSSRTSLQEARRTFRWWQRFAENRICRPWYRWQIGRGIALGELPPDGRLHLMRPKWPGWSYVNPKQEAEANQIQRANATKSISQIIRERGDDPQEVFDELEADYKELARRAIPVGTVEVSADRDEG